MGNHLEMITIHFQALNPFKSKNQTHKSKNYLIKPIIFYHQSPSQFK